MEEITNKNEQLFVQERLFNSRVIHICGEINQKLAQSITTQLLTMDAESDKPIRLFINSQGGHVESGDTIHDVIKFIKAPVTIIGTGWVASAGALIYVSVSREQRFCLPNTRFYCISRPEQPKAVPAKLKYK